MPIVTTIARHSRYCLVDPKNLIVKHHVIIGRSAATVSALC